MNHDIKALKSGVWYTISDFLTKSIGMITTPIFTRMLNHEEFGLYNNFTSWLAIITIIVTLNLQSTFISARYDYEDKFDEYIYSTLCLSSVSCLIWIIIFNLFQKYATELLGMEQTYINCMMVYLLLLPAVSMFQARERYRFEYKVSVLISCVITIGTSLLSVVLVLKMSDRLKGRILGSIIPTIFLGILIYIIIMKKGRYPKIQYWKYALPISLPFIPHLLSLTALNSLDRIMITDICGPESNALYSLAYTCSSVVTVLLTSLNTAFAPWLGEKLHENLFDEICSFSKKYISVFLFLAVGIMLVSPEIMMIMGGKSYMEAEYVMPPVMLGCVCQFIYTMYVNVEQFKKKTIGMALASVSAAAINYGLNALFIPKYGYIAAAYTTLISFLWLLIAHMFLVWRLGLSKTYPNKFFILAVGVAALITLGVNILYSYTIIRYCLLVVYSGVFVVFALRYKEQLLGLLKKKTAK